jgi:hypothetical protein
MPHVPLTRVAYVNLQAAYSVPFTAYLYWRV